MYDGLDYLMLYAVRMNIPRATYVQKVEESGLGEIFNKLERIGAANLFGAQGLERLADEFEGVNPEEAKKLRGTARDYFERN